MLGGSRRKRTEEGLETELAPGARVRDPRRARPRSLGRLSQSHGGTHTEAQLPGVATVFSFAFLEGQGNGTSFSVGPQPSPGPSTAPLPAPNSQDTRGQGVGWAGRTQLHRHQQRQNPAVGTQSSGGMWGGDSLPTPRAGPASLAPCTPGERRSPPVPGGKHSDAGPHTASKLGNVGPWAVVGATQKGPLPRQSRVKSHSVTLAP